MPQVAPLLRERTSPTGGDRAARLERTLLVLHGVLMATFAAFTVLPLLTPHDASLHEYAVRVGVTLIDLLVLVDLKLRGERPWQLGALTLGVGLVASLQAAPVPGDVSGGLSVAAFALSAVRLLRPSWHAPALAVAAAVFVAGRAAVGEAGFGSAGFDDFVLAVAMAFAVAAFIDSLEHSTRVAMLTDVEAASREAELAAEAARNAAIDTARRVLHDDVLTALRTVSEEGADPTSIRRECAAAIASVEAVVGHS